MNAPFLRLVGCPAGVDPVEWRKAVYGVDFVQGYGSLSDCTDLEADRA